MLEEARRRGLVGPGPLEPQLRHALAMGAAGGGPPAGRALDLGTGGGLPGLVLAAAWPHSEWVLLDGRQRSSSFVGEAVARLGLGERVHVLAARAEEAGRDLEHRGRYALVTARGFGPPAVTAECAAPFLAVGGRLVVSEPPGPSGQRWPAAELEILGVVPEDVVTSGGASFAVLVQAFACPNRFPRRTGVPQKRPLFSNPAVDVSRETNPVLDRQGERGDDRGQ